MSAIQDWFYLNKEGVQIGPISSEELRDLVEKRIVRRSTIVWTPALDEWVKASKVGKLFDNIPHSRRVKTKRKAKAKLKDLNKKKSESKPKQPVPISHMIPLPNSVPQAAPIRTSKGNSTTTNLPKPIPIPTAKVPIENSVPPHPQPITLNDQTPVPTSKLLPPGTVIVSPSEKE